MLKLTRNSKLNRSRIKNTLGSNSAPKWQISFKSVWIMKEKMLNLQPWVLKIKLKPDILILDRTMWILWETFWDWSSLKSLIPMTSFLRISSASTIWRIKLETWANLVVNPMLPLLLNLLMETLIPALITTSSLWRSRIKRRSRDRIKFMPRPIERDQQNFRTT